MDSYPQFCFSNTTKPDFRENSVKIKHFVHTRIWCDDLYRVYAMYMQEYEEGTSPDTVVVKD